MTSSETSTTPRIQLAAFTLGPYATNCYVVSVTGSDRCWIIDAGYDPDPMIQAVRDQRLQPEAIILTHAHCDHVAGLALVLDAFPGTPVSLHRAEQEFPASPELNLSIFSGEPISAPPPDTLLEGGETLDLAGTRWAVLHTPGHSPGWITLHNADAGIAIVGDTLFADSIGRYDFPTSDFAALERSIREKLYTLPDDTKVYPGHGETTSSGREKKSNPFIRA